MVASILIVSHNRKDELLTTLNILEGCIETDSQEVLVFLDGCTDDSFSLIEQFEWVKWFTSKINRGASKARNFLFKKASGEYLIGFDDDAHPKNPDFILRVRMLFGEDNTLGIISFQEVKSSSIIEGEILSCSDEPKDFYVNNFIGCGFAIKRGVYEQTRGFPLWMDIYGEEDCLSMEVLEQGYNILFTYKIQVIHRVNKENRKRDGQNYRRFRKQVRNATYFYLIYYPFPAVVKRLFKLHIHNIRKYAVREDRYFKQYFIAIWNILQGLPLIYKFRKTISNETLLKYNSLPNPKY